MFLNRQMLSFVQFAVMSLNFIEAIHRSIIIFGISIPLLIHARQVEPIPRMWFISSRASKKILKNRRQNINIQWLHIATVLDPRFKNLKCLLKAERLQMWKELQKLYVRESGHSTTRDPTSGYSFISLKFFNSIYARC